MNDRDCANCGNRSDRGCKVWECEFKPVFSESKQPIIEELEKIKEKIDIECDSVDSALDVILDKISELKGGAE